MRTNDLQVSGKAEIEDLSVKGKFDVNPTSIGFVTDNGYTIKLPKKLNWFQRLLFKLLSFEVKKHGDTK